jgi:hypothetical protein
VRKTVVDISRSLLTCSERTTPAGTSLSLDPPLLKAAFFIFLSLLFDFLQYVLGTTIWFVYFRHKEKQRTKEDDEVLAPPQLNWPTWGLFYLKSAMLLVAYSCYIIPFLASRFGAQAWVRPGQLCSQRIASTVYFSVVAKWAAASRVNPD